MNKKTQLALTIAALLSSPLSAQTLSGVVIDKAGKPVSKAKISIANSKKYIFSDDQGRFSLTNLEQGIIELHVTANSFSHVDQQVELTTGDISQLNIVLSPTVFDIINVNATPLHASSVESALPINVLSAEDLRMKQASTLGETLKNEVGVHSSYYGPVSSSPIIRGLDGPRVMITQNGLDAGDASRVGPDHAVSSEASTATQIEVLRGPATLFYGSGAIGGVVNVVDNRVPHTRDTTAEWLVEHNTISSEELFSTNYNTALDNIAFHIDGYWRKSGDYKLAGPAELEHDEHHEGEEEQSDRLENSSSKSSGFTLGSSYLTQNGFVGISYGRVDRQYDIPGHAHHDEHEEQTNVDEPAVYADMKQHRYQMISELSFDHSLISKVHSKFAYTDYLHKEIEAGVVGTTFDNSSIEGRFDLFHTEITGWSGALSLHYKGSDFTAIGEEAFTPPSQSNTLAVALLEEKHFDNVLLQFGARIENFKLTATPVELALGHDEHQHQTDEEQQTEQVHFAEQSFKPLSLSSGLIWSFRPGYNFAISTAYSQRAPTASELFSFGPHIGTRSFEIGALFDLHIESNDEFHVDVSNQNVAMETAYNIDFTLRKYEGNLGFIFNTFYNKIDNFYYQRHTGLLLTPEHGELEDSAHQEDEESLPLLAFNQQDAKMYGIEAQVAYQATDIIKLSVYGDYIRGKLTNGDNLPRIPPMRLGGRLNYEADDFSTEFSLTHYFKQNDTGVGETSTAAYTMLDMNFNYYFDSELGEITLYLKGHNLTNEHARVHSSFLKDLVPLPGRGFSLGIRGGF